jgi:RNA polymerase sigma factor (sigma-70 family)
MAEGSLGKVLAHIRRVAAVQAYRELADSELLEHFVTTSDDSAFTVLIERYGPLVLGLCRRMLGSVHDAEDVCQATFLVLARKASSIRKSTALSSWLHGVACRAAGQLKRDRARRQRRERGTHAPTAKDPAGEVSWREAQTILDEELERLPERYRAPLILCYLDGTTRDEAARRLCLATGTLHARLQRGRDLLRERLTRRGLTFSGALSAAVLSDGAARASVAPIWVCATAKAALAIATNQPLTSSVISTSVLALTREALKTMFVAKLKLGTAVALTCVVAGMAWVSWTSTGVAQDATSRAQAIKALQDSTLKVESDEDFIRRVSRALRGTDPTPTEVHFFVATKDAGKREKLIDLMIQERRAKKLGDTDGAVPKLDTTGGAVADTTVPEEKLYVFDMRGQPWSAVFDWLTEMTGREFSSTSLPSGTYNVVAPKGKKYTIPQIIDLVNDGLLAQRWLLLNRRTTFTLVSADEKIDPALVPRISRRELSEHGDTEIVSIVYQCIALVAEDSAPEVKKQLGPFGEVIPLHKANQLILQDSARNLKRIVDLLDGQERAVPGGRVAKSYAVKQGTAVELSRALALIHKGTRISRIENNRVTVVASPEDQRLIECIISLDEASASTLAEALRRIVQDKKRSP